MSEQCSAFRNRYGSGGGWAGALLRQAGLEDVGVEARVQMYPPGNSRRTIRLDLVQALTGCA